jgi:DNA-directed RNA polymerase specialized sigma24 family protein
MAADDTTAARELTERTLEALLARLGPDRDEAAQAYEAIRQRLIRLFEYRGCADAAALADETMSRVARRLAEGVEIRAAEPYAYFAGVASMVFREVLRRREREQAALRARPSPGTDAAAEDRMACLEKCLEQLPPPARELVLAYHGGEGRERIEGRVTLARDYGLDLNALRVRVHRLRERLEECVRERLRNLSGSGDTSS